MTTQQNPNIVQLFDLTGKAAIVTGGAMGIGQGIALRLAEAGAAVMLTDINLEAADNTVNQIRSKGGKAEAINADASSVADARRTVQEMMNEGHGGKIINIASIDALHPTGNLVHYDASKGGVVMVTKALALEFGPHNITVNAIAPGAIQTPGADGSAITDEIIQSLIARIPLGRMGAPDDIARVVLFLASEASNYMTGSLLVVDGGFLQT